MGEKKKEKRKRRSLKQWEKPGEGDQGVPATLP